MTVLRRFFLIVLASAMALAAAAQITFSGNSRDVMEIEPEFSTGLKRIFVLNSAEGVSMTYTATTENPVTWSV